MTARRIVALAVVFWAGVSGSVPVWPAEAAAADDEYRRIRFPTEEVARYSDDFGDPRSGGRTHEGNDLMGRKSSRLLAAVDGTVSVRLDSGGSAGHMLTIKDSAGWSYRYLHLNNDTPGTDDGAAPVEQVFAPGITSGARVKAGQPVAFMGDSGNAEDTPAHLHFEIRRPDGTALNPWVSLRLAQGLPAGSRCGYDSNPKAVPSVAGAPGYWVLGQDGGVFSFGSAAFAGSTGGMRLNQPVVGMAPNPTGGGYWLVARDGGIFAFGDATFFGSTGAMKLNQPIVGMAAAPGGAGYWLSALDGGVFAFGAAPFVGSVPGATPKPQTVRSMAATPSGKGYWMVGSDGGVFAFGDAPFLGSLPGVGLCRWPGALRMAATSTGRGYWVLGDDGSTWSFGDAPSHGATSTLTPRPAGVIDLVPVPVPPKPPAAPKPPAPTTSTSTTTTPR